MILEAIATFLISFTQISNPSPLSYQYEGSYYGVFQSERNIMYDTSNRVYYIDSSLSFNARIQYNDGENYSINNFDFEYNVSMYQLNTNNGGSPSLLHTLNLRQYYSSYQTIVNNDVEFGYTMDLLNDTLIAFISENNIFINSESYEYSSYAVMSNVSELVINMPINLIDELVNNVFDLNSQVYYENGYNNGYSEGYQNGKADGYSEGLQAGMDTNGEAFVIFNGILNVAMIPINVFLKIFEFEVFGINISSLVSALLSVAILIIVIRLITGKKSE